MSNPTQRRPGHYTIYHNNVAVACATVEHCPSAISRVSACTRDRTKHTVLRQAPYERQHEVEALMLGDLAEALSLSPDQFTWEEP